MPLGMEVLISPGDFGLVGTQPPSQKGGGSRGWRPPIFGPCLLWPKARWIKMALGMEVGLGPVHIVLDGDTAPLPKTGGRAPQICGPSLLRPNSWIHQDATWYGGRPRPTRHCVRCGPSYPKKKGTPTPPIFCPCLLWPNGWMDEDAAWYRSRPRPRPHCTRRGPSSRKRGTAAPLFLAHVYCGYGRPSQLLLSSCFILSQTYISIHRVT